METRKVGKLWKRLPEILHCSSIAPAHLHFTCNMLLSSPYLAPHVLSASCSLGICVGSGGLYSPYLAVTGWTPNPGSGQLECFINTYRKTTLPDTAKWSWHRFFPVFLDCFTYAFRIVEIGLYRLISDAKIRYIPILYIKSVVCVEGRGL